MPKITALVHAHNSDAAQLTRALDSLRPCDELLVINHGGDKGVEKAARERGATVKAGLPGVSPGAYIADAKNDWILCLRPSEALSDRLTASLREWKDNDNQQQHAFRLRIRERSGNDWQEGPAEIRLVNRTKINWTDELPPNEPDGPELEGELLRFTQ